MNWLRLAEQHAWYPPVLRSCNCCDHALQGWVNEMAAFVKTQDSNHLLTVGEEGFYTSTQNQTYCNPSSSARKLLWQACCIQPAMSQWQDCISDISRKTKKSTCFWYNFLTHTCLIRILDTSWAMHCMTALLCTCISTSAMVGCAHYDRDQRTVTFESNAAYPDLPWLHTQSTEMQVTWPQVSSSGLQLVGWAGFQPQAKMLWQTMPLQTLTSLPFIPGLTTGSQGLIISSSASFTLMFAYTALHLADEPVLQASKQTHLHRLCKHTCKARWPCWCTKLAFAVLKCLWNQSLELFYLFSRALFTLFYHQVFLDKGFITLLEWLCSMLLSDTFGKAVYAFRCLLRQSRLMYDIRGDVHPAVCWAKAALCMPFIVMCNGWGHSQDSDCLLQNVSETFQRNWFDCHADNGIQLNKPVSQPDATCICCCSTALPPVATADVSYVYQRWLYKLQV